jgi:hypothetical protein
MNSSKPKFYINFILVIIFLLLIAKACYRQAPNISLGSFIVKSIKSNAQKAINFDEGEKYDLRETTSLDWDTLYTIESSGYDQESIKIQLELEGVKNSYSIGLKSFPNGQHCYFLFFEKDKYIVEWTEIKPEINFPCYNFNKVVHFGKYSRNQALFYILTREKHSGFSVLSESCFLKEKTHWLNE